jgi:hypothetical protein
MNGKPIVAVCVWMFGVFFPIIIGLRGWYAAVFFLSVYVAYLVGRHF